MKAADRRRLANSLIRRGPIEDSVRRELGHVPCPTTEDYVRSADASEASDDDQAPETP
jgi:hypothetical protein